MYIQIFASFVIYLLVLVIIGFVASIKSKSSDFALGGRETNYWVSAIALQASDTSHWLFLAFPGAVFSRGIIEIFVPFVLVLCMFLNWNFIAPRLRRRTEKYKVVTLFSFFEKQLSDSSGALRIISAIVALAYFSFFIASGFVAAGNLFEFSFNFQYHTGVIIGVIAAILYVLIGGYHSVAWCNFFQGMFLLLVLIFIPTYAYFIVGGCKSIAHAANLRSLSLFSFPSLKHFADALLVAVGWGIGYFGQPHLFNFFMAIKDPKNIKYAKYLGGAWQLLALLSSFFLGIVGVAYFSGGITNPETIFISITTDLFPPLFAGFMLCALLAATLTTLNSQILASSSILAQDLYRKVFIKNGTPRIMFWASRCAVGVVALIAAVIALKNNYSIYNLVAYAWSGIGSSFAPLTIASLYWKKTTRYGALASVVTGATTVALWPFFSIELFPMIPGFIASSTALVIISLFTQPLPPKLKSSPDSKIENKV